MNMWIHLICLMDDRKKELTDAVDCPEHNELFGLNRVNPNQQLMHLMDKTRKLIWKIWVGYWRSNNDVLTDTASEVLNTLKKVIAFNQTT